ncbi:hypothetical protein ACOTHX_13410 [Achromobacter xylosoxidans]
MSYDIAIFALGFEARGTNLVAEVLKDATKAAAIGFNHGRDKAYDSNREFFLKSGVKIFDSIDDAKFESILAQILEHLDDGVARSVFVDISCFSRVRLATIVYVLFSLASKRRSALTVDFAYSLAKFEKPNPERYPNTVVGPAHQAFAGWSQGGYSSTAAVLGLGYEQDQALGVVEYLQAGEVWAFSPNSPINEYKPEVKRANDLLLSEIPPRQVIEYDVCAPASIVATLESVVRGLGNDHSVVLVPFGPKIFVLCSLIVAAMRRDVAVWRVSQGSHISPQDRYASEEAFGLRLFFGASQQ